jgi:hypothetical protein
MTINGTLMTITWTLDLNDANSIFAVLGKLPYEQVNVLITGLRAQTEECVRLANLQPPQPAPDTC